MANVIEYSIKALDDFSATMDKQIVGLSKLEQAFVAAGVAGALFAAVRMAERSLENAEAMGTAAEKANMATAEFSALAFAAKMSNTETSTLTTGLKMLGRAVAEADASPAGKALKELGISSRDASGELRPTIDVLYDVADSFAAAKDDANKTKAALEIFGRAGVDMVPMLNQGSGAIKEMMHTAQALGMVITDDFAKSADQVNDNLATMGMVIDGVVNTTMAQLAPVLEEVTGWLVQFATEGDGVQRVGESIATGLRVAMTAGTIVAGVFETLVELLTGLTAAAVLLVSGDWSGAFETLKNVAVDSFENVKDTVEGVTKLWDENAQSAAAAAAKQAAAARKLGESLEIVTKQKEDARKEQEALYKAVSDSVVSMQSQVLMFGMSADRAKLMELAMKGAKGAQMEYLEELVRQKEAQAQTAQSEEKIKAIIESQQTPMEQHIEKLREINRLREEGTMGAAEHEQAIDRENMRWEEARVKMDEYKMTVTDVMGEAGRQTVEQMESMGSAAYQVATMISDTTMTVIKGIGDAVAASVIEGANLGKALENVAKTVLKTVISTLIQIGIQRLILSMIDRSATVSEGAAKMGSALGQVYLNSFASAAAIPVVGFAIAPSVAMANTAIAVAGVTTAVSTGAGIGAAAGAAHGGLDYVPKESTYLLDQGERVLSPRQNEDLTGFLENGGGSGGVVIQSLVVHVLENATNADAFTRMDKIQLRQALGQPVIDALNEMFNIGVRPDFASQMR